MEEWASGLTGPLSWPDTPYNASPSYAPKARLGRRNVVRSPPFPHIAISGPEPLLGTLWLLGDQATPLNMVALATRSIATMKAAVRSVTFLVFEISQTCSKAADSKRSSSPRTRSIPHW
jgi:hypothetical protein